MDNIKHLKEYLITQGYTQEEADKVSTHQTPGSDKVMFSVGMSTKRFINKVLILELQDVVEKSPWLGFVLIGNGIEFLGKCIDSEYPMTWDKSGRSRTNFNDAVKQLNGLNKYAFLLKKEGFDFYTMFRCGLTHGLAPKGNISLSSGSESANLFERNGVLNFHVGELFKDLKMACEDVISRTYTDPNKMNEAKIFINGEFIVSTEGTMRFN